MVPLARQVLLQLVKHSVDTKGKEASQPSTALLDAVALVLNLWLFLVVDDCYHLVRRFVDSPHGGDEACGASLCF